MAAGARGVDPSSLPSLSSAHPSAMLLSSPGGGAAAARVSEEVTGTVIVLCRLPMGTDNGWREATGLDVLGANHCENMTLGWSIRQYVCPLHMYVEANGKP